MFFRVFAFPFCCWGPRLLSFACSSLVGGMLFGVSGILLVMNALLIITRHRRHRRYHHRHDHHHHRHQHHHHLVVPFIGPQAGRRPQTPLSMPAVAIKQYTLQSFKRPSYNSWYVHVCPSIKLKCYSIYIAVGNLQGNLLFSVTVHQAGSLGRPADAYTT